MANIFKITILCLCIFFFGCMESVPGIKSVRSTFYAAQYKDGVVIKRGRDNNFLKDEYRTMTRMRTWNDALIAEYDYRALYDRKGNMIEKAVLEWNDKTQTEDTVYTYIYRYDGNNQLSCEISEDVNRHKEYIYDHDLMIEKEYGTKYEGDLPKEKLYEDGSVHKYEYNQAGQKTEIYVYAQSDTLPVVRYIYHYQNNSMTEDVFFRDEGNKRAARQSFHWDDHRLLRQRNFYNAESDTIAWRFEYEYDRYKNLQRITSWRPYNKDEVRADTNVYRPVYIIEREIEYY